MLTFGKRLRNLRRNNGMTQAELAEHLSVTPKTISFYENDQRELSFATLRNLAKFFKG